MLRNLESKIEKLEKVLNLFDNEIDLRFFQVDHENVHVTKESILQKCSEMERAEIHISGQIKIRILPCDDCDKSCLRLVSQSTKLA